MTPSPLPDSAAPTQGDTTTPAASGGILTATRGVHAPPEMPPGNGGRQRRFIVLTLLAAAAIVLVVAGINALVDPYGAFGTGIVGPAVWTDRTAKVQLVDRLRTPPRVVVLGSSRAMKVQPSFLTRLTGLPAFNAAVSSGRPVDAYVFARYLHDRFPGTAQSYFWLLDQEAFGDGTIDPTLLSDTTLAHYLPSSTRWQGRLKDVSWLLSWRTLDLSWHTWRNRRQTSPPPQESQPPETVQTGRQPVFAADGYRVEDANTRAASRGRPLVKGIAESSAVFRRRYTGNFPALAATPRQFFERALAAMNTWGATPVIMLSPVHPKLLHELAPLGWDARHRELLAYLRGLQSTYRFVLLDLSRVTSFGGKTGAFYDGVHMKPSNYRRLMRFVLADPRARAALTHTSPDQASARQ